MAVDDEDADVPDTGAVFTFGRSKFNNNEPGKFWLRDETFVQVCCGDEHTALISESGKLFMFGDNAWGQLGLGNTDSVQKPSRVKILKSEKITNLACGKSHTLVATASGKLYAFGANGEGQLGLEDDSDRICVPKSVQLPAHSTIKMVVAGADHSALLTASGEVYVWGCGSEGQLGLGDVKKATGPTHLPFEDKVVYISCGYYHTAMVTASGQLYAFGDTDSGKLGLGEDNHGRNIPQKVHGIPDKVVSVSCGNNHTVAVTDNGKVYSFGDGSNGQLGHGNLHLSAYQPQQMNGAIKERKIVFTSCGESHTALISDHGVLYTFGDGRHGKLALSEENFSNQFLPTPVTRFRKFFVQKVSCGGCHLLVIAKPRHDSGGEEDGSTDSLEEAEEVKKDYYETHKEFNLNTSIRRTDSGNTSDLLGSISARNRRREKQPEYISLLSRTLPLLNGSKTLPPLSVSKLNSDNESNRSLQITAKKEVLLSSEPPLKAEHSADSESIGSSGDDKGKGESNRKESLADKSRLNSPKPLPKPRNQTHTEAKMPLDTPVPTPRAKSVPIAQAAAMAVAVKTKDEDESGIEESDDDRNSMGKNSNGSYGVDEIDAGKYGKQEIIKETKELQSTSNAKDGIESVKASSDDEKKKTEDKIVEPKKKDKKKRSRFLGRRKKTKSEERESEDGDSDEKKTEEKKSKKKNKEVKPKKEKKKEKSEDVIDKGENEEKRSTQDSEEDEEDVKKKKKGHKVEFELEKHKDKESIETEDSEEEDNESDNEEDKDKESKKRKNEGEKERNKNEDKENEKKEKDNEKEKEKEKHTEKEKKEKEKQKEKEKKEKEKQKEKEQEKNSKEEKTDNKKDEENNGKKTSVGDGQTKAAEKKSRTCTII